MSHTIALFLFPPSFSALVCIEFATAPVEHANGYFSYLVSDQINQKLYPEQYLNATGIHISCHRSIKWIEITSTNTDGCIGDIKIYKKSSSQVIE